MVKGTFLRSTALTAMISAMTLAVPAQAQDVDRAEMREQRMERRAERQEQSQQAPQQPRQEIRQERPERQAEPEPDRQAQRASRQEWRQQRQAERAQAQQAAPQVQGSGSGIDRRLEGYREGTRQDGAWSRNQPDAQASVGGGATAHDQRRGWGGRDGSPSVDGERNRTYTDSHRDGRYRDANRDGRADTIHRDSNGSYRSGYRDGRTADAYRDHRQQHKAYRNGYRSGSRDTYRSGYDRHWDNNWRRDNRYNWYSYRNQYRDLYRAGRYYSPYRNYNYNRLSIGFFLDSGFYGNRYWVNDPWQYRLPEVYGPYKWVRYYDDVILVDIYTGEVVDVIHNFFW